VKEAKVETQFSLRMKNGEKKERRNIILSKGIFITLLLRVVKHHYVLKLFLCFYERLKTITTKNIYWIYDKFG
jgi:hypothetical protein